MLKKIKYFDNMFKGCSKLKQLYFPNFDTKDVSKMQDMFKNCENLEYIDFQNYKINSIILNETFFNGIPKNSSICIEKMEFP